MARYITPESFTVETLRILEAAGRDRTCNRLALCGKETVYTTTWSLYGNPDVTTVMHFAANTVDEAKKVAKAYTAQVYGVRAVNITAVNAFNNGWAETLHMNPKWEGKDSR